MRPIANPELRALVLGSAALFGCPATSTPDETPPDLQAAAFRDARTIRLTFSEPVADPSAVNTQAFRLSIGVRDVSSTVYYGVDYDFGEDTGYADDGGPLTDGDPTADPTIADPTDTGDPTVSDSSDSSDPTDDPTEDPTDDPTEDPTYDPSYDPTDDPDSGYEGGYADPSEAPALTDRPIPPVHVADLDVMSIAAVAGADNQVDLVLAGPITDTSACEAIASLAADSPKVGLFLHYKPGTTPVADPAGNPLAAIGAHWVDGRANAYAELQGDFPRLDPYLPIPCP